MQRRWKLSSDQRADMWNRWKAGQSLNAIGRALGKDKQVIHFLLARHGGIAPPVRRRSKLALTLAEREDISRGIGQRRLDAYHRPRSASRLLHDQPDNGHLTRSPFLRIDNLALTGNAVEAYGIEIKQGARASEHEVPLLNSKWCCRVLTVEFGLVLGLTSSVCFAQTNAPAIRSQSNVVLVPTLVKTRTGNIVFGLSASDFIVEDNGLEQSAQLDESVEADPISVVVAVQVGRTAVLQLQKSQPNSLKANDSSDDPSRGAPLSGLGTMVESYIGESTAAVAVVTFDSQAHLLQDFTNDIPAVAAKLRKLRPGDDGAAILDALLYSNSLFDRHRGRRVIILISESRDHGSHVAKLDNLVQQLGVSNTLVYSVTFSPARAEFMRDAKGQNPSRQIDLMKPLVMAVNGLRKNAAATVAELTGGEYEAFGNKRTFDAEMDALTADDHNRYLLSFQPLDPKPGPHYIKVRLRRPECTCTVTARSMYWAVSRQVDNGTVP